jgi:rod shape-determining protein MreC
MLCLTASLVLLVTEQKKLFPATRALLATAVYPLQQLVSFPIREARRFGEILTSHEDLLEENRKLRDQDLMLHSQLLRFSALEQENIRLRGLLETSFKLGEHALIAELLSVDLAPYEHVVVVNKGSRFGIFPGQPVMDANGVVGQVLRVNPLSADVMLITDPNHAIPVQVNRNGVRTIAVGSGEIDRLNLPYVSANWDIHPGDLLVTSGLGGVFPQGYPVARVNEPSTQPGLAGKLTATPLAMLDRNRELLLVWSNPNPIPRVMEMNYPPAPQRESLPESPP